MKQKGKFVELSSCRVVVDSDQLQRNEMLLNPADAKYESHQSPLVSIRGKRA